MSRLYTTHFWHSASNKLYDPSSPEHLSHNNLCLPSASLQDMSRFYAWIHSIQSCNGNIFQALCPVLCADVIKVLTRMQLAGIDSPRQLWFWISQYFEIKVLIFLVYNYFLVLETSFTVYLFLCSGTSDLPFLMPMGRCRSFKLF